MTKRKTGRGITITLLGVVLVAALDPVLAQEPSTAAPLFTLNGHEGWVSCVAFSPDGKRIVSGSWDDTLIVWDSYSGEALLRLRGHTDDITSVAFSPDGKRIASAADDRGLRIWSVQTGKEVVVLHGHAHGVTCLAFTPISNRIVTGSKGALRIWNVP